MKQVILFVLLCVSFECNGDLSITGLLSGAHKQVHNAAAGILGGFNLNFGGHIGVEKERPPPPPPHIEQPETVVVIVEEQSDQNYGQNRPNPNQYGNNNGPYNNNYRPPQQNRPGYNQHGQNPNGNYNNDRYQQNNYNNPNHGRPHQNPEYNNQGNNGNYHNHGNYGENHHGHHHNHGNYGENNYGNNRMNPNYGNPDQYENNNYQKPYSQERPNPNKPNYGNGGDSSSHGNYGNYEENNNGHNNGMKPNNYGKPDQTYQGNPENDNDKFGNPTHVQPIPTKPAYGTIHGQGNKDDDSSDHEKSTIKPDDEPLFVPLHPNEYVYGGDKINVNAPKRETDNKEPPADVDEDIPIDIRFQDS